MEAWMRYLSIRLTSKLLKKTITFESGEHEFNIKVTGTKYLSAIKDNFVVEISNLTYNEIVQMIDGQYEDVEIIAGYLSGNRNTIFNGGLLYISNDIKDRETNTVYLICASKAVAKFGKRRLNLTLNSGINMYSALTFICKRAGISDANIGTEFKVRLLSDGLVCNGAIANILDQISKQSNSWQVNSDSINGSTVNVWDVNRKASRLIKLREDNIMITNGYPTVNSDGLSLAILPTFNFMPGDVIQIDNNLIDISVSSVSEAMEASRATYFDNNGQYMILEETYCLENRGSSFNLSIRARSFSSLSRLNLGV